MEDDRANLAELYQQAQEEKAAFLELNQSLQRKLAEYLRTVKKNEVPHATHPMHTASPRLTHPSPLPSPLPTAHTPLPSPSPLSPPRLTPQPPHPCPSRAGEQGGAEKSVTDQEQRYFKCLAQVNELRDELKRLQAQFDRTAMEMKRRLDDKETKAREIKEALVDFKRDPQGCGEQPHGHAHPLAPALAPAQPRT